MATLAAYDLRFIRTHELAERIDATLSALERMDRFEGHLFNWYDSERLVPLAPRYVSSVDSGNLAAALLTLGGGLRQLIDEPEPRVEISSLTIQFVGVDPDGALRVRLASRNKQSRRELRESVWSIVGGVAELATFVRETRASDRVSFEVVTGNPRDEGPFATHGHAIRLEVEQPAS